MADAVTLTTLLKGYRSALTRLMFGLRISADSDEAFFGLFEALNWAVVVDKRLADLHGPNWAQAHEQQDLIAGFRYARDAVHHDWADALELAPGAELPTPLPFGLFEWMAPHACGNATLREYPIQSPLGAAARPIHTRGAQPALRRGRGREPRGAELNLKFCGGRKRTRAGCPQPSE